MKYLFLVKTYHDSDKYFENKNNFFLNKSYKDISQLFCEFYRNWLSEFYLYLRKDFECEIIFPNMINLFKNMDKKNNKVFFEYLNYLYNDFQPDIIISNTEEKNFLKNIKHKKNTYKFLWKSSSINLKDLNDQNFYFNHILSGNKNVLNIIQKTNLKSSYLLLSVPNTILNNKNFFNRKNDLLISGSLGYGHSKRKNLIKRLISNNINLEQRSRDNTDKIKYVDKILGFFPFKNIYKKLQIKRMNKNPLYGMDLYNHMANHQFILNSHSDFDKDAAINLRVFESLSQSCLLFSDKNNKVDEYFTDGENMVVYKNAEDLVDKINFYKKNLNLAEQIVNNGYEVIKKKHTTKERFKDFKEILQIKGKK